MRWLGFSEVRNFSLCVWTWVCILSFSIPCSSGFAGKASNKSERCPLHLERATKSATGITDQIDPNSIVKRKINLGRLEIRYESEAHSDSRRYVLIYQGEEVGSWRVYDDGEMSTVFLGMEKGTKLHRKGLGTLVYLISAVQLYDRTKVRSRSDAPSKDAIRLWRRLEQQGLAEGNDRDWIFTENALAGDRMDLIRAFTAQHLTEDLEYP